MKAKKNFIQGAIKHKGALTRKAKAAGMTPMAFARKVSANPDNYSTQTVRQANFAKTLQSFHKKKKK